VRPMFHSYPTIEAFIEFIAYYKVQGIERFVLYYYEISDTLLNLISQKFTEFVILLPFKYPFNASLIHAEGQVAANHDCLYRYHNDIIIFIDYDEFIVPKKYVFHE